MASSEVEWYETVRSRIVDLVGDYAGKELFLLEGDSLLLECFGDSRLDFHDGFQLLHAVYIVEAFLGNLIRRGCNFHIVFFDAHAELCIPSSSPQALRSRYLLARSILIQHLISKLCITQPQVEVHLFAKYRSQVFRQYLESAGIYFIMSHDGSEPSSAFKDKKGTGLSSASQASARAFRSMISWLTLLGFNVALINEVEWRDSKVMTRVIEGDRRQRLRPNAIDIEDVNGELHKPNTIHSNISEESLVPLLSVIKDSKGVFHERDYLTIFCLSKMLGREAATGSLASAMLLHLACLRHLSFSQRRMNAVSFGSQDQDACFKNFVIEFSDIARNVMEDDVWREAMEENEISCDLEDLVDGRLLRAVIHAVGKKDLLSSLGPGPIRDDFKSLCGALHSLCMDDTSLDEQTVFRTEANHEGYSKALGRSVLPFSNPVFDKHLGSIHISVDTSSSARHEQYLPTISKELSHWHNPKKLLDPKKVNPDGRPVTKWRNPLRSNQMYMAEMTAYAASLTNTKGKILTPEIISASAVKGSSGPSHGGRDPKAKRETKPKGPSKAEKENKSKGPSKADLIIAENKAKKDKVDSSRAFAAWDEVRKRIDKLEPESRYLEAGLYINRLEDAKSEILLVDVEMYRLQALLHWWASFCKQDKKKEGYSTVALIWDIVRRLGSSGIEMTKAATTSIGDVCSLLGLPKPELPAKPLDRPLSFKFQLPLATSEALGIDMPAGEFQLLYCGPYMDRNTDASSDSRVPSFQPDRWQRQVLDELDANNSVFVVAPTSAGKTFISFYAMEKVLRNSNDDILVYVAPTKALVNQIAAEIQGRFRKTYPHAGHSVWAIHTRDHRINNPAGCQILVTVPHILQIMLLAPSNAQSWAPRVQRIIFDEIHSIGQAEDGVVWEQLLLLAPCQIIALSATVGNPEEFSDWLTSTQKSSGIKLTMIQHKQRYSDLRKFVYTPPKELSFKGLNDVKQLTGVLGLDGAPNLQFFHPVASLVNKSRGLPDDLTLEARDCLLLWRSMVKYQTTEFSVPKSLHPEKALPQFVKRVDIFAWEATLKKTLVKWMEQANSPFDKVMEDLSKSLYDAQSGKPRATNGDSNGEHSSEDDYEVIDPEDLCSTTFPLILRLQERNALPAIFFNYDRLQCEKIARAVLTKLQSAEQQHKETSKEWRSLVDGFEQWKKLQEAKGAQKDNKTSGKKKKKGKGGSDDDEADDPTSKADAMRDGASQEKTFYESFDPDEPLSKFTFADPKRYELSELKGDIRFLERKGIQGWLCECLKRGIGVHHAGMNRKYRQIVEVLFRKGFLRVVIATGTLALGINMPCTTVVFSGDSVFLTALNFRQAAGRAGRRGFDLLGNVVFQGVSMAKACRLLSSRLPDLNGHFPITTTLVLRLFALLHESKTSTYAVQAINSLLSQPRLYLGGENFKHQVLHHLRFSIEYLRKQYLLGSNGEPINFANCVSHLYYTENSSFAFHALLRGGYFQDLCVNGGLSHEELMRTLMIVMAHLFCRQNCRNVQQEFIESVIKKSPSIVFLPPLPKKAAKILREHNKETLATYCTYVETFAEQHIHEEERSLPLTRISVGGNGNEQAAAALDAAPATKSRSAFVALSGTGDDFDSIADLCTTVRTGVFLEQAVVPHMELYPDETKSPLNAYIYDFFRHGALEPLEAANGIRKSEVWFLLNDFSLILATIITSLANFLHLKETQELDMLNIVGSGDALEINEDENIADEQSTPSIAKIQPKQTAPTPKKKAVVESWDAEAEGDEAESSSGEGSTASNGMEMDEIGLLKVYKTFVQLKAEFDEKFKAIFA